MDKIFWYQVLKRKDVTLKNWSEMEEHITTGREEVTGDRAKRDSSGPGRGQVVNCSENDPGPSRSTQLRYIFFFFGQLRSRYLLKKDPAS